MTVPFDMEIPSDDLRKSEAQLEQRPGYTLRDGVWWPEFQSISWLGKPAAASICNFVQDGHDCQNPREPKHSWCRFHIEADAFNYNCFTDEWYKIPINRRYDIVWGFAVKHHGSCYRAELEKTGPERVVELIEAWNLYYSEVSQCRKNPT